MSALSSMNLGGSASVRESGSGKVDLANAATLKAPVGHLRILPRPPRSFLTLVENVTGACTCSPARGPCGHRRYCAMTTRKGSFTVPP